MDSVESGDEDRFEERFRESLVEVVWIESIGVASVATAHVSVASEKVVVAVVVVVDGVVIVVAAVVVVCAILFKPLIECNLKCLLRLPDWEKFIGQ